MQLKELYTRAEAAAYMKCTVASIGNYIKQGRIHATKIGGRYLIPSDELRWIAANGLHPTSAHWKEQARQLQARYRARKAERELAAKSGGSAV